MKDKIAEYCRSTYDVQILLLIGSRATGMARQGSDWDLITFVNELPESSTVHEKFGDELLDIVFIKLPVSPQFIIDTAWSPVPAVEVLQDQKGLGAAIAKRTEAAYQKGPSPLGAKEIKTKHLRLERFTQKVLNAPTRSEAFYYLAFIYSNMITQIWFQLQGEWPQPIYQALETIKKRDLKLYTALEELTDPEQQTKVLKNLPSILFQTK